MFASEIRTFERESNDLHEKLRKAFDCRNQSRQKYRDWMSAADRYRKHNMMSRPMFDLCFALSERAPDPVQREFMFDYIEIDPYCYKSGYLMERIVRKLKKIELTQAEKFNLRELLL